MNISLSVLFVEILSAFTIIDALPGRKWISKTKEKCWNWQNSELDQFCSSGHCIEAWKCPTHLIAKQLTSSCVSFNNKQMVCCMLHNGGSSYHVDKTDIYAVKSRTVTSNEYFKQTPSNFWRQRTNTNTANYKYTSKGQVTTPCLESAWNRRRPTPISSLGNFPQNVQGEYISYTPVTNILYDVSIKHTPLSQGKRTTVTWKKPTVLESKIIFPTESAWMQKTTKHRALTTNPWKKTFGNKSTHSTSKLWGYTHTKSPRTTKSTYSTKPTMATNYSSKEKKNQDWGKPRQSPPTRRQNLNPTNTVTSTFIPSTPVTRKISSITSFISETSRIYRRTTILPNVNNIQCGIRNQRLSGHRQRGNYNYGHIEVDDTIHSDMKDLKSILSYERIVGGEEAEPFSWPWVVALYKVTSRGGNRLLSSGSLITENFILTAAHVFTPDDLRAASFVAMLGTHNAEDAFAEHLVSSVIQHPRYEQRYYYHDIALLKLNKPVTFNNFILPVCLPSTTAPLLKDKDLEGRNVTVMGWGDESFGGKSSRVLKEATFPIVSRNSCNTSYIRVASNRFPKGITNDMLCAGDPNGGRDACQGDSGGPLTSIENGKYTQVGIVSFGYKCGDKDYPGVYTKVAPYLSWIDENIHADFVNYYH